LASWDFCGPGVKAIGVVSGGERNTRRADYQHTRAESLEVSVAMIVPDPEHGRAAPRHSCAHGGLGATRIVEEIQLRIPQDFIAAGLRWIHPDGLGRQLRRLGRAPAQRFLRPRQRLLVRHGGTGRHGHGSRAPVQHFLPSLLLQPPLLLG